MFDFRGFGESPKLLEPYSVSDYAEETYEFMRYTGVEKPLVIAHSFGVRVAVKCEKLYKGTFEKMLLTGPAGIVNHGVKYKIKVKTYRLIKKLNPNFANKHFGSSEYKTLDPIMQESYKKIVNEDLRLDAETISCPVLIIEGKNDKTTPISEAKTYNSHFQNSALKLIDGGHFAFIDAPLKFNLTAEEFFSYD